MKGKISPNKGKKNPLHSKRMTGVNNPMYGRKRDDISGDKNPAKREEVRNKIKENNPMKTLENRTKISLSKIGKIRKPFSKEWKEKLGNKFRGIKRPEHSTRMKRDLNPNWKGGISCDPYCEQWLDKEYKDSIKERDGNICLNPSCQKESNKLCIHHIDYDKKNCHPFNLISLCNICNSKANKDREWHRSWYNSILFRRYVDGRVYG
jgi:hypothetical protein